MTNKPGNGVSRFIGSQTGISIGVLALLISPLISAVIFFAVSNEKIKALETRVTALESRLCEHTNKGVDGLSHPEGIIAKFNGMSRDVQRKLEDMWVNHCLDMDEFARENNQKITTHKKTVP